MVYIRLGLNQNLVLENLEEKNFLNMTNREKFNFISGPCDYYERAISELERIAIKKGYKSIEEASEKNNDFLEIKTIIENKFVSYVGTEIHLIGLVSGFLAYKYLFSR